MSKKAKLIIEDHPQDYTGSPFITLIEYNGDKHLTVVDNHDKKNVSVYVLDACELKNVSLEDFLEVVNVWFDGERQNPISIELAKNGLSEIFRPINQQFTLGYVTRVIGPFPKYEMGKPTKVKKRKRKKIPKNVEYVNKF